MEKSDRIDEKGLYSQQEHWPYTIAHRERVVVINASWHFLGRQSDVDWLYQDGASIFIQSKLREV